MFKTSFMRQNVKNVVTVDICVCKLLASYAFGKPQNFINPSAFSLIIRQNSLLLFKIDLCS